jgi:hypothetical protein
MLTFSSEVYIKNELKWISYFDFNTLIHLKCTNTFAITLRDTYTFAINTLICDN